MVALGEGGCAASLGLPGNSRIAKDCKSDLEEMVKFSGNLAEKPESRALRAR